MFEVRKVAKRFGGLSVLADVSFEARAGSIVGLIGPNGAGKTTLLNIASGYLGTRTGQIFIDGEAALGRSPRWLYKRGLSRTFQDGRLFTSLTVQENLSIACQLAAVGKSPSSHFLSIQEYLRDHLDLDVSVNDLPHGTRMIVGLAMAVARTPKILLMDEPLAGLDTQEVSTLLNEVRDLANEGCAVVLIEHNIDYVVRTCDSVVVLDQGVIIAAGNPHEVIRDQNVIDAYLGVSIHE